MRAWRNKFLHRHLNFIFKENSKKMTIEEMVDCFRIMFS